MFFILLWLCSLLMRIANAQTQCAAYFDYSDRWRPLDVCLNTWSAEFGRNSVKRMCDSDKTFLLAVHYYGFDCIGSANYNFTLAGDGNISAQDPASVFCQQDNPICPVSRVGVVNRFFDPLQTQCNSSNFTVPPPEFSQDYTSIALDICYDFPSGHSRFGESVQFSCSGVNLLKLRYLSPGCGASPDSSTSALTFEPCDTSYFDAVLSCGGNSTAEQIIWSLNSYPADPTDPPMPTYPVPVYNQTASYTESAGVVGLFAFFTFMCCCGMACCICSVFMCCILRCIGDDDEEGAAYKVSMAIYYIFWLLLIAPFKAISFGCKKIFFCRGCSLEIAKRFFSFLPNLISTIIILSRFGSAQSGIDFEKAAAEGVAKMVGDIDPKVVQGLTIITFVSIGFALKAKDLWTSHQVAKGSEQKEIVKSYQIKNLQALIITSSDTMFKIFAGLAIIVGSDYSGTDSDGESKVVDLIKGAAVIGAIQEFIDMADEYLTKLLMFVPKIETSAETSAATFSCAFNADVVREEISGKLTVDSLEPGEPAQSAQKTILWNAMWAGVKLFLLLIEQIFAFAAAVMLAGSGDVIGFLVIVIICCFGDILLAAVMCTKYQRLSVGLFCKYYLCCLYEQCKVHCEKHWIKLDPVEKGLKFNTFGGVVTTKPEVADKMQQHTELHTKQTADTQSMKQPEPEPEPEPKPEPKESEVDAQGQGDGSHVDKGDDEAKKQSEPAEPEPEPEQGDVSHVDKGDDEAKGDDYNADNNDADDVDAGDDGSDVEKGGNEAKEDADNSGDGIVDKGPDNADFHD